MNNPPRNSGLDLLRLISILMIVTFHYLSAIGYENSFLVLYANGGWGSVGTTVFFLLSGYLLIQNNQNIPLVKFYQKRALSLFPTMHIMFLVFFIFHAIRVKNVFYGGHPCKIILSLLGIDYYAQFYGMENYAIIGEWFTAIILFVYILFPLLRTLYKKYYVLCTWILGLLYLANIYFEWQNPVPADAGLLTGLFLFWLGMGIHRYDSFFKKNRILLISMILIFMIIVLIPLPKLGSSSLPWKNLLGISLFVIIYQIDHIFSFSQPIKTPLYRLSTLSFGVYLCHHTFIYRYAEFLSHYHEFHRLLSCFGYVFITILSFGTATIFYKAVTLLSIDKLNTTNK